MLVELFKDREGFVRGFRHGWTANAVPPVPENTFEINPSDFQSLVNFLAGRPVTVSPLQGVGDWASRSLALIAHDIATVDATSSENSGFFKTALFQ